MFTDTHAHIHHPGLSEDASDVIARARRSGVNRIISVGCDGEDSARAIALAEQHEAVWATVGLHPHEAHRGPTAWQALDILATHPRVVAIGECGLDYYRNSSAPAEQELAFRYQIELAHRLDLPMSFHIRDAFDDFFKIIDTYPGTRGVVHCFTSTPEHAAAAVERGFYIALNGIMTFTKDDSQLKAAQLVPLDHLLLETDCPFLAPTPKRGSVNEPVNIPLIASFLADLRGESVEVIQNATSANAEKLFKLR